MRQPTTSPTTTRGRPALSLVAGALVALFGAGVLLPADLGAQQKDVVSTSMTLSSTGSSLQLELADGSSHEIELRDGRIVVDGSRIGSYREGSELEQAWRDLLRGGMQGEPGFRLDAQRLLAWDPPAGGGAGDALEAALDRLLGGGGGETAASQEAAPPGPGGQEAPGPDRAAGAEGEDTVSMTGPDGSQLVIAPGRLSFGTLLDELARLDRQLSRIGDEAGHADENLALVVHDDYQIPSERTVPGNLALLDGELRLGGAVDGDVLVLDGRLILEPSGRVSGDVLQVGGSVERRGGRVSGEFVSVKAVGGPPEAADAGEVPEVEVRDRPRHRGYEVDRPGFFDRTFHNVQRGVGGVIGVLGGLVLLGLAGLLAVYFVRPQLEVVADTARHNFGRSFGVGLAGQFLFFPVLLVLVVAVITWLVIPFYVAASAVAVLAGYVAVAHATGEAVARQRFQYEWMERLKRSNSYYYVLSGLVVLLLPFALTEALWIFGGWLEFVRNLVHFVAVVITWVALTAGLGAVLISRGGQRRDYTRAYAPAGEPPTEGV